MLYSRVLHTHKKYVNIFAPVGGKKDLKKILIKFDNNIQICYIINVGGQYSLFINHQKSPSSKSVRPPGVSSSSLVPIKSLIAPRIPPPRPALFNADDIPDNTLTFPIVSP